MKQKWKQEGILQVVFLEVFRPSTNFPSSSSVFLRVHSSKTNSWKWPNKAALNFCYLFSPTWSQVEGTNQSASHVPKHIKFHSHFVHQFIPRIGKVWINPRSEGGPDWYEWIKGCPLPGASWSLAERIRVILSVEFWRGLHMLLQMNKNKIPSAPSCSEFGN